MNIQVRPCWVLVTQVLASCCYHYNPDAEELGSRGKYTLVKTKEIAQEKVAEALITTIKNDGWDEKLTSER